MTDPEKWVPLAASEARLHESVDGHVMLDIGSTCFIGTWDPNALGALYFAYGLDLALDWPFALVTSDVARGALYFCSALLRRPDRPEVRGMAGRGLEGALELTGGGTAEYREVSERFERRYATVLDAKFGNESLDEDDAASSSESQSQRD